MRGLLLLLLLFPATALAEYDTDLMCLAQNIYHEARSQALAEKIAGLYRANKDVGYVTICDDVNSVFAHPDILSCTISLDA